jgi:TonB family protein
VKQNVTPTNTAVAEDIKTSTVGEEAVNTKPETKPVKEVKPPVEEPKKPVINQGALLPGKTNTGGQGNDNAPGNVGKIDGGQGGGQGGSGNNPNSVGPGGTGISIKLDGRSALSLPKPRYTEQEDGTVVVKITVDRDGNVINATTDGVRGSTTTNKNLHNEAITAARKAKFNLKADAPPEQIGFITYTFMRN